MDPIELQQEIERFLRDEGAAREAIASDPFFADYPSEDDFEVVPVDAGGGFQMRSRRIKRSALNGAMDWAAEKAKRAAPGIKEALCGGRQVVYAARVNVWDYCEMKAHLDNVAFLRQLAELGLIAKTFLLPTLLGWAGLAALLAMGFLDSLCDCEGDPVPPKIWPVRP